MTTSELELLPPDRTASGTSSATTRACAAVVAAFLHASAASAASAEPAEGSIESRATEAETVAGGNESLRVSVAESIDDAALLPGWILERHPDAGSELELPDHEQWIEVRITGETYAYDVTVTPMRDGLAVGSSISSRCECNAHELLDRLEADVGGAVDTLQNTPADDGDAEPTAPPPTPPPRWAGPTWLGIGGIAIGTLGLASLVGGAVALTTDPSTVGPSDSFQHRVYRPLGAGLITGGVTAALSGATLLLVDLTRCRRRASAKGCGSDRLEPPPSSSSTRPRVLVFGSSRGLGLGVHGRF